MGARAVVALLGFLLSHLAASGMRTSADERVHGGADPLRALARETGGLELCRSLLPPIVVVDVLLSEGVDNLCSQFHCIIAFAVEQRIVELSHVVIQNLKRDPAA